MEKKIFRCLIGRLDGERIYSEAYRNDIFRLVEKGMGGFIIFGGERDETRHFIRKLQSVAEIPLFIASDIERGVGQQIKGYTTFPCQMAVSAAINRADPGEIMILHKAMKAISDEASDAGINMPLIPVLDVNKDPDNPIICTRAFGDNPEDVAWFGTLYVRELQKAGLVSCAKHFPGHGDTSIDSHIQLPVIKKSYQEFMDVDVLPFREVITTGVSSIMIGHLHIPVLDARPATLSRKIVTGFLRDQLGFEGLVMTDALNMKALENFQDVPLQCLDAGIDILLHPADPEAVVSEILSALISGRIPEERIETAYSRIVRHKERLQRGVGSRIVSREHAMLSAQISEMSISLLKNTSNLLPVTDFDQLRLYFAGDSESYRSSLMKKYFINNAPVCSVSEGYAIPSVFALYTTVAAWKGNSGIEDTEKEQIQRIIKKAKHSIVISFGSPYVLRHFRDADVLIAAYEATEQAQNAVIKCLDGRMDFRGRLPVKIDF